MATVVINNATFFGTTEECAAFVRAMTAPPEPGSVSGSGTVEAVIGEGEALELREGLRVVWNDGEGVFDGDLGTVIDVDGSTFWVQWDDGNEVDYSRSDFGVSVHPYVATEQTRGENEP